MILIAVKTKLSNDMQDWSCQGPNIGRNAAMQGSLSAVRYETKSDIVSKYFIPYGIRLFTAILATIILFLAGLRRMAWLRYKIKVTSLSPELMCSLPGIYHPLDA